MIPVPSDALAAEQGREAILLGDLVFRDALIVWS